MNFRKGWIEGVARIWTLSRRQSKKARKSSSNCFGLSRRSSDRPKKQRVRRPPRNGEFIVKFDVSF